MEVFPLFASPLVQIKVKEDINKLNDIVSKEPFAFTKSSGSYNAQISKDRRILERYLDLKELLLDYFNQFSEEVLRYDGEFNITTSWFTKIKTGCSSQYHCHKNSFYSGVLYFGDYSNDNGGAIKFNNPIEQFSDYQIAPKEYHIANCNEYAVYPQKNILIIFPSYLSHMIDTYYGEDPRYSLAFNIVPVGEYGRVDSKYSTDWF